MRLLSIFLCCLLILNSCQDGKSHMDKPKDCLSEVEMTALLKDLHLAQARIMILNPVGDSLKNTYLREYAKVFAIHHTNTKQFQNSLKFYCSDPEKFDQVYNKIIVEMNQLELKNN